MNNCLVCKRIELIKKKQNLFFVKELETGYVVLADQQSYFGYTIFLCKQHVHELHELDADFKNKFLLEMAQVSEAVFKAFKPDKLNYEMLGNTDAHAHWHLIPRRKTDEQAQTAIWAVAKENRSYTPTQEDLAELKEALVRFL
jgi:diadenosine tetraphosphate (Ap4A) HIT family hydrolase